MVLAAVTSLETGPVGFVRGAIQVNVDRWSAASRSQSQLDDLGQWAALIGGLGITNRSTVVVYDDGELKYASRIRYLLAHYGVPRTLMVEGGWPALQALMPDDAITVQSQASPPVRRTFRAQVKNPPIPLVTRATVVRSLHRPGVLLVDVRTPAEYDGTDLVPPITRGGHIPGAINLPDGELFVNGSSGTLLDRAALISLFEDHGVVPGKRIIVYCHDGAKSSLVASVLTQVGYPSVGLYYLSYVNWQEDPQLPVAT